MVYRDVPRATADEDPGLEPVEFRHLRSPGPRSHTLRGLDHSTLTETPLARKTKNTDLRRRRESEMKSPFPKPAKRDVPPPSMSADSMRAQRGDHADVAELDDTGPGQHIISEHRHSRQFYEHLDSRSPDFENAEPARPQAPDPSVQEQIEYERGRRRHRRQSAR